MEFTVNVDLNELIKKANSTLSKIDELIKSKKKNLQDIEKFRKEILNEKSELEKQINNIKKEKMRKVEIEDEKKKLSSPLFDDMEENIPAQIHEYEDVTSELDDYNDDLDYDTRYNYSFKSNIFNFGDIIDTAGNRHYGYAFVGKDGKCETTTRSDAVDSEFGVTVPFNICRYLTDSVSKYSNLKNYESCIVAYELPYYDITVQKYDCKKGYMYEYVCWDEESEDFDFDNWHLEQINIETGEKTKPKLKVVKKDKKKK